MPIVTWGPGRPARRPGEMIPIGVLAPQMRLGFQGGLRGTVVEERHQPEVLLDGGWRVPVHRNYWIPWGAGHWDHPLEEFKG